MTESTKKRKLKSPDAIVLILILLIIVAVLTFIMPAGEYDRYVDEATGTTMVDPNSYHLVERSPQGLWAILKSISSAIMNEAAYIMNFFFIIGGAFNIITETGALNSFISNFIVKVKGKEKRVIPLFLGFWLIGGATIGTFEECLPFIPMTMALTMALGFDSFLGMAVTLIGVAIGYMGAIMNPYTIAVAQTIAGLPLYSGMGLRIGLLIAAYIASLIYLLMYADSIKKNPEKSVTYAQDKNSEFKSEDVQTDVITGKQKMVLFAFLIAIIVIVYGVIKKGFYLTEMGAVFLALGIVAGFLGGLGVQGTLDAFIEGAKGFVYAAICVGVAKSLSIILTDGKLIDTIVYSVTGVLKNLPPDITGAAMFLVQGLINIAIPSGSGQAAVTMPIMIPIADVLGLTRQTAVLAFQMGDGLFNIFTPTCAALMAGLAMAKVSWLDWLKWFWKLFLILILIGCLAAVVAAKISFGPF